MLACEQICVDYPCVKFRLKIGRNFPIGRIGWLWDSLPARAEDKSAELSSNWCSTCLSAVLGGPHQHVGCGISSHKGQNWKPQETFLWFCALDFFCVWVNIQIFEQFEKGVSSLSPLPPKKRRAGNCLLETFQVLSLIIMSLELVVSFWVRVSVCVFACRTSPSHI